ncbi:outer membrane beta-barrel protein [Zooshikella sp. RANM57]|uniref:outer membrane beta-barrel protein n=1 Tax=Zooshikella sp. RANM57 TaxID=3425863 RepID=UPI003D6DE113
MKKTVLTAIITSTLTAPCFAQDNINPFADEKSGFYLGIGAGKSSYDAYNNTKAKVNTWIENIGGTPIVNAMDTPSGETISKLFLGYRINKYLALELNYSDLNTTEAKINGQIKDGSTSYKGSGTITDDINGIGIKAIGFYPITNSFDLKASLGAMKWKIKEEVHGSIIESSGHNATTYFFDKKQSKKGTSLTLGLGANYTITDNVTVGLQWERIKDVGHKNLAFGETDIDTYTLSAQYNF